MTAVRCLLGVFRAGAEIPRPLELGNLAIEEYLRSAAIDAEGKPVIELTIDETRASKANTREPERETTAILLHSALEDLTQNDPSSQNYRSRIGVIFADRWSGSEGSDTTFGMMFDVGFEATMLGSVGEYLKTAREGCVVFVDAIRAYRENQEADDEAIHRQILWTTVHELGHVFNLWHPINPGASIRFMNSSDRDRIYNPRPDNDERYAFHEDHEKFLHDTLNGGVNAPGFRFAWPGGADFGTRGNFGPPGKDFLNGLELPRSRSALELRIGIAQEEFWSFEPVELDIEIRVPSKISKHYRLPATVDPGYASFSIWIEEPDGCRRRYRSPRIYCENPGHITVTTTRPFRRDLSIFGQSGGYTFQKSGRHRIFATWILPNSRVVESNLIEVGVKSRLNRSRDFQTRQAVLTDSAIAKLLYHRGGPSRKKTWEPLADLADRTDDRILEANIRYALGRFFARAGEGRVRSTRRSYDRRALRHLDGALELSDRLSPRRTYHSRRVLDELRQR